jgi:sensor histidine kinase YesM
MLFFQHRYRYWFILGLSVYTYVSTEICGVYEAFHLPVAWYTALGSITCITAGTWEFSRLLYRFLVKKEVHSEKAIQQLAFFFMTCAAASAIFTSLIVFVFDNAFEHPPIEIMVPLKLTITYALLINLLFHLLHAVAYFMERYKNKQLEAEELLRINTQAQLQSIKTQINPHFLFNNLNVLSTLVLKGSHNANDFIEAFSRVYQYILRNQEKELVTLRQEIAFLEPYTYLLQQRFPDCLDIHIDVDEEAIEQHIIPIALQMLVENAIKHNVVSKQQPLQVNIFSTQDGVLMVTNTIQLKRSKEASSKIGLKNIDQRYNLITGKSIVVKEDGNIFSVSLPLIQLNTYADSYY